MISFIALPSSITRLIQRFVRDRAASSAVEFSILMAPFFFLLMGIAQVGIFYMAQSALDTGVIKTAEALRANFVNGTNTLMTAAQLKTSVSGSAGALIANDTTLSVEIRQFSSLTSAPVAIVDGTVDYGSSTSTLVLRAQSTVVTLAPGLSGLNTIESSALVRRCNANVPC
jgi:Flp pilus assembly protein TadG